MLSIDLLTMWLQQLELSRIFWSAFLHADETHIFYNMSSLLWKVCDILTILQVSMSHDAFFLFQPEKACMLATDTS